MPAGKMRSKAWLSNQPDDTATCAIANGGGGPKRWLSHFGVDPPAQERGHR